MKMNLEFELRENFTIASNENIDKLKFSANSADYMIKLLEKNIFRIWKLSNTYNSNVIFDIKLKREQDPEDLKEFEKTILRDIQYIKKSRTY